MGGDVPIHNSEYGLETGTCMPLASSWVFEYTAAVDMSASFPRFLRKLEISSTGAGEREVSSRPRDSCATRMCVVWLLIAGYSIDVRSCKMLFY
jgi:hypothetical protein